MNSTTAVLAHVAGSLGSPACFEILVYKRCVCILKGPASEKALEFLMV